jgi:hypothetical protein
MIPGFGLLCIPGRRDTRQLDAEGSPCHVIFDEQAPPIPVTMP